MQVNENAEDVDARKTETKKANRKRKEKAKARQREAEGERELLSDQLEVHMDAPIHSMNDNGDNNHGDDIWMFLKSIGLTQYYNIIIDEGFDSLQVLSDVNDDELKNVLQINKLGHRKKILKQLNLIANSLNIQVNHDGDEQKEGSALIESSNQ